MLMLVACSKSKEDSIPQIIVATSADNPPYEYIKDGKVIGFDIDVVNAIADSMGKKVIIKNLDFPALLPALATNNIDMVIAALSATENRKAHIDFSDGYASTMMSAMFAKKSNFKSIDDLVGKVIGVQAGTTWEGFVNDFVQKHPGTRGKSIANNLVLVEDLKSGNIDAVIMEEMQVAKFVQNNSDMTSFVIPETKQEFSIALPKGSELKNSLNEAIKKLRESGEFTKIKEKWVGK